MQSTQESSAKQAPSISLSRRRFPSRREVRAVELGADEVQNLLEWLLRDRSRALAQARLRYRQFCTETLARIERYQRKRGA